MNRNVEQAGFSAPCDAFEEQSVHFDSSRIHQVIMTTRFLALSS